MSSATPYITIPEFIDRTDERLVGRLLSTSGDMVSGGALLSNTKLQAAVLDASGMVESAATRGGKYSPLDLSLLTGAAKGLLFRIISDIAMGFLHQLRPEMQIGNVQERLRGSLAWLEMLENGIRIFHTDANEAAGRMDFSEPGPDDCDRFYGIVEVASRLFGVRSREFTKD